MKILEKIIKQKISVLDLAQALGNVTDACRCRGVFKTHFYELERRGWEGMRDLSQAFYAGLRCRPLSRD